MNDKARIFVAELIGTLILVVGGPGTAIIATGSFGGKTLSVGVLGVALAFGLSLLVAAYAIGTISGCHINPAVTIGLWAIKKVDTAMVPIYMGAQVIGGLIGAGIIYVIATNIDGFSAKASGFASNGYGTHSPGGFGLSAVIITEIVFTGLFVFLIASTSRKSMSPGFTGIVAGFSLALVHLVMVPIDNASVNPARSLATAVFQGSWALSQVWVFIVFPLIGGILGGLLWRFLVPAADA